MYGITSEKFNNLISKPGRTFRARLVIGQSTAEGFVSLKINFCSNNGDALTLGSTISQYVDITMEMPAISLLKTEFKLEIGLLLDDGTVEYVPMGLFTPDKISKKKNTISFQAFDRMMKLSVGYVPGVSDSTDTINVLQDVAKQTGVPIKITGLSRIAMKKPIGLTCREVLMYVAQMYGCFAIVNRAGTIELVFYQKSAYNLTPDLGINNFVRSDSFTVERIVCATGQDEEGKTVSISAGTGESTISISNQFMTQAMLNNVFAKINGFKYDAVDCPVILGDPRLDPWDIITITDIEGITYTVPLMNLSYTYDGGLSCTIKSTVSSSTETENDFKGPMQQFEDRILAKIAVIDSLTAKKATIEDLEALRIKVDNIVAGTVTVEYLKANYASIEHLKANYTTTEKLEATYAKISELDAKYVTVEKLTAEYITTKQIEATYAKVQDLDAKYATIEKLNTEYLTATQISAKYATISELKTDYITSKEIEAEYARLDKANIEDGWITTAMIGTGVIGSSQIADGSITDAKIVTLTANKITAGRLDAAEIEVVNLNCANLTVGSINGHQIANGAIDMDKLSDALGTTITTTEKDVAQALKDAGLAQNTADSAQRDATKALQDALNAFKEAQAAKDKAGTALTAANGKNKNYYQSTAPTGGTYAVGDTWFNTAKDMQISHWNGSTWVVEEIGAGALESGSISTDKIASDVNKKIEDAFSKAGIAVTDSTTAKNTANNALSTANTAKTTADSALSKANTANSNASSAINKANAAQTTADGKNTFFYQTTAPSTSGRKVNDIWFDTDDGNKMYYWNGTAWTAKQFGTNAIANASIINALIADATIQNAKIANLDAAKITSGYISASRIKAGTLTADKLAVDTITASSGVLADACILTANIKDLAVTGAKIADATIGTAKIANLAVTGAKIADATITNAKIANLDAGKITSGYISADRIQAGSLVIGKLDSSTQSTITGAKANADKALKDITNLKIGGRNLIVLNTSKDGFRFEGSAGKEYASTYCTVTGNIKVTPNDSLIYTVYIPYTDEGDTYYQICFYKKDGTFISRPIMQPGTITKKTSFTTVVPTEASYARAAFPTSLKGKVKLEVGNKATDWSPAPEDFDSSIATLDGYIANWCYNNNKTYINGGKIYTGTVTANQLAANSVVADKIATNAVTALKIAAGAISADKLASNSVTAGKIAANAVSAGNIAAGAITTDKLSANAVTSAKIAANAITSDKIVAGAVTAAKIASKTITTNEIAANTITTSNIKTGTLTTDKIATKAITADKLNVTSLSAISANLGAVTAATITNKRDGENAIILNSDNISIYDWANGGQYAGKISSGHIGGTTSLPELDIIAQNYLVLKAPRILINDVDVVQELTELNGKLNFRIVTKQKAISISNSNAFDVFLSSEVPGALFVAACIQNKTPDIWCQGCTTNANGNWIGRLNKNVNGKIWVLCIAICQS